MTQASNFGKQERVYDGVDAKLSARVQRRCCSRAGGISDGRA